MTLTKEYACKKCSRKTLVKLVRTITASGISQVYWQCSSCKDNANGGAVYIKHEILKQNKVEIDDLPVVADYRRLENACVVCGALGAERHHWAPRYLFGDRAEEYPTAYLCNYHHMLWHRIVTPNMCEKKND